MKTAVLLYNTSCIYEIVILNYFLKYTGKEVVFVSCDGNSIIATEGYSINVSGQLWNINPEDVELMIIPGEMLLKQITERYGIILPEFRQIGGLIAGICAGVDVLEHAGILEKINSTYSSDLDVVADGRVITARANGYVDFAIEVAKEMDLFEDEADLQETIAFWKNHQRME